MGLDELIRGLKYIALYLPWTELRKKAESILTQAVERLEAQQARIRELEAERDVALRDLRNLSACNTCSGNGVKCHVGMPVAENDVRCGGYEWRGAKDTNVPSKEGENHG